MCESNRTEETAIFREKKIWEAQEKRMTGEEHRNK